MAANVRAEHCPGAEVAVDPQRAAYRAFELRRGVTRAFNLGSVRSALRAYGEGYRQSSVQGDPWQQGGSFVIDTAGSDYDTALQRLDEVLGRQPYLLGDDFSAADLLCAGPFAWFGDQMPATPAIRDWVARCMGRPAVRGTGER